MPQESVELIWELLNEVLRGQDVEVTDVQYRREGGGQMLRIFIDSEQGVGLETCSRVTKRVKLRLDEIDFFYDYLEVSSPGLDRRLTRDKDFERFAGSRVEVKMNKAWEGRKRFTGILRAYDGEHLTVEAEEGMTAIPRELIRSVNLKPEF
ncbi:MAG: ribosome maturation factor RimP [Syntrophomonadaceae bacterium]|nr:ribosome maturation factor RimP [Syntrophomonadaceae bacterium]